MTANALGFAALLLVAGTGIEWFRRARAVRLPENRSGFLVAFVAGAGVALAALLTEGGGWVAGVPAVLALSGAAFFVFTMAISRQQVAPDALVVGAPLPDFSALDENGDVFQAASLAGHPVLLKFFRGHW